MKLIHLVNIVIIQGLLFVAPQHATAQSNTSCRSTISYSLERLDSVPGVSVPYTNTVDISRIYRNVPEERSMKVTLGMQGQGTDDVFNSPMMMADISATIFEACNRTGVVSFGRFRTDEVYSFVWTRSGPNRAVCAPRGVRGRLNWGQTFCYF
jgi:hypothetical protein